MDAATINTPEYFTTTFGVSPAQAQQLAAQAGTISTNRGGGIAAEPAGVVPPAPSAPPAGSQPQRSARAEYEQLIADRASGKISDATWSASGRAREQALANQIIAGRGDVAHSPAAPGPTMTAQQMTDLANEHDGAQATAATLDSHYAVPAEPAGYEFPRGANEPTDADIAADTALKGALFAERVPASLVNAVTASLRTTAAQYENETAAQCAARLASQRDRLSAMWAKSGEGDFNSNIAIVDRELARLAGNPTLRPWLERAARYFTPIDIDSILQFAKYRAARR